MKILTVILSSISLVLTANPFITYTSNSGLINTNVNCVEQGHDFIWVGTNGGLNRISFKGEKPVKFSPRRTSRPVTAIEDDGEVVWVGLKGKGVYMMPKKNYKFIGLRKDIIGSKNIKSINKIKNGLKVYTEDSLFTFNFKNKSFKVRANKWNSKSLVVKVGGKEIRESEKGVLVRYNELTKSTRDFVTQIKSNMFLNFQGGLLIASTSGLVFYNPLKDTIQFGEPTIQLLNFQLDGEDSITDKLDLDWDEYVFKYNFNYTELGAKENITLSYSLNGPNGEVKGESKGSEGIELIDLEHGDYKLSVSAINQLGINSKNSLNYKFSIANPLMDSIWLSIIIIFIGGVWTIVVMTITSVKFKKDIKVLEDALIEKTNRLNQLDKDKYGLVDQDKVDI